MTKIQLTNHGDLEKAEDGTLPPEQVRTIEIDALVDSGCTMLVLPEDVVTRLGLREKRRSTVRYADGRVASVRRVGGLAVEILGRPGLSMRSRASSP